MRIDGTIAQTYLALRVNGVDGGRIRLRFGKADLHGDARERIVTQITESRRRRLRRRPGRGPGRRYR